MAYVYWSEQSSRCDSIRDSLYMYDDENKAIIYEKLDRMKEIAQDCLNDLGPFLDDDQYESVIVWNNTDEYHALLSEVLLMITTLDELYWQSRITNQ